MEITFSVTTVVNGERIKERITKTMNGVQAKLDAQVLKDSNYYCPMYTGTLKKSAIIGTVLGSGLIQWNTPYAKAQYYGFPKKYLLLNPNAKQKWFEAAKAAKLQNWVKLVNDEYIKQSK